MTTSVPQGSYRIMAHTVISSQYSRTLILKSQIPASRAASSSTVVLQSSYPIPNTAPGFNLIPKITHADLTHHMQAKKAQIHDIWQIKPASSATT